MQNFFSRTFLEIIRDPVNLTAALIGLIALFGGAAYLIVYPKLFMLGLKNLRRNLVRTLLTSTAIGVLAFMITMIWTVIYFIGLATTERAKDLKIIITERWQIPSQMPMTHASYLDPGPKGNLLSELRGPDGKSLYYGPNDFMIWSFYGGTMDPNKRTLENLIFFFAMDPDSIIPMMDDLEDLDPKLIAALKNNKQGCLLGIEKMRAVNKRIGERFTLTSMNYKDIDLEFEILGVLPDGRYNQSAIMHMDYLKQGFEDYARKKKVTHPLASRSLNLIWIRVSDREQFDKVGSIIENATELKDRPVKVETASSGISSFLDAYKDLLAALKYLLVPLLLMVMTMVMAVAISITVRERRMEMAVMKVLGYRPNQILLLVIGEALFIGALSGFLAALLTYSFFNGIWGGIPFRIAFFPVFRIPEASLFWGLAIGSMAAFLGSIIPAWTARSVKVTDVFSKVA
ncbi:MAG TPA: ABC transporter permease [Gemmataceae bacterium]|nr:ABC transporter permease [Gemmataceae bacterium]